MSYIALYRKWRPLKFEDVVEQKHVVETLKNTIKKDRIAHAYLFCGTRGTGKTTMAKIFSRAINCLSPNGGDPCNECKICKGILDGTVLDVIEIDAASNNSVDNIREIRDEVVYTPAQARFKVYIIDEVHMLSIGAFNALLKTLEEPPSHVVFVLATTEPHKLPATILSRCQRFDFRRISLESIVNRLRQISEAAGVKSEEDALLLIAKLAEGALRDAISIFDQSIASGIIELGYQDVLDTVGLVTGEFIKKTIDSIIDRDIDGVIAGVERLIAEGKDVSQFATELTTYFRNLLIVKMAQNPEAVLTVSRADIDTMKAQSKRLIQEEIIYAIREISAAHAEIKWSSYPRITLEVVLIKLCERCFDIPAEDIIARLNLIEKKIAEGVLVDRNAVSNHTDIQQSSNSVNSNGIDAEIVNSNRSINESHTGQKSKQSVSNNPKIREGNASKRHNKKVLKEEGWSKVISEIKSSGRMMVYTAIQATTAIWINEAVLGIVFENEGRTFNKMVVSKADNLEVIKGAAIKMLGRDLSVKCIDSEDVGTLVSESTSNAVASLDESTNNAQNVSVMQQQNTDNHDIIDVAKQMAELAGVEVNIIEE